MRVTRRSVNLGLAASLATPAFSGDACAADETIKIGMVLPVTGPAADSGKYALTGAKIALDRVNQSGGVLGKQVELVTEDDQTTNPPCSRSPSSPLSPTLSPSSARSGRRRTTRWPQIF